MKECFHRSSTTPASIDFLNRKQKGLTIANAHRFRNDGCKLSGPIALIGWRAHSWSSTSLEANSTFEISANLRWCELGFTKFWFTNTEENTLTN